MSLLSPLALLFSALTIPLLLLYFLKVRRRQQMVSSLLLWDSALRDREASTFFQRLQRDPLMLLQILALLALTLALARPAITVMGHGAKKIVVVLDTSASMKATDVSPSRFVQAQRAALALVGRLGEGAEVMVVDAGIQPNVLAPFTRDRDRIVSAIRAAQPADIPSRLGDGIRTARALVGPDARAEIHVFTDGAHPEALRGQGDDVRLRWSRRGPARPERGHHEPGRAAQLLRFLRFPGLSVGRQLLRRPANLFVHAPPGRRADRREVAHPRTPGAPRGGAAVQPPGRRSRARPSECL